MIDTIKHFFAMGGYGFYVFSSYGIVLFFLFVQWFVPWQRFRKYLQTQYSASNQKIEKDELEHSL